MLVLPEYADAQDTVSREVLKNYLLTVDPGRDTAVCTSLAWTVVKPTYPGGHKELIRYVNQHIDFPQSMADTMESAEVFCRTIIDRKGKVKIVSQADKNKVLFAKVKKLIETMPSFIPGQTRRGNADFQVYLIFYFTKDITALSKNNPYFIPVFPTDNPEYQKLLNQEP